MSNAPRVERGAGGLRVVCENMPAARSVALGVWIGVGSRFEQVSESGVSHFLEHLLFKGTPRFDAREIAEVFDGLGGEINAATSRDYTVVYVRVLDEHAGRALEVVADMIQRPAFTDLDRERDVVLEEIAMYEDEPQDLVHDMAISAVYPEQPLGRPVIGTTDVISVVPEADMRAYHGRHYRAPNVVVAGAGGISPERLVEISSELFGHLTDAGRAAMIEAAESGEPHLLLREKSTEQYHLCVAGPGVSRDDPRRHAQSVLDTIIGGSMSSRLFQEIREKRGLVYSVGSYTMGFADTGLLGVYLGTREESLAEACDILGRELERIAAEPVPGDELRRAKEHIKGRIVLSLESPATRMNRIGRAVVSETELLTVDELLARVDAVSAEDVLELAASLWHPSKLSAAAIGPRGVIVESALTPRFGHLIA
ncbi:MAG: insulinase family protein [Thermoleophilia bacterium]|nr:insulinase family protein [Thermoleophilia bacterium]